MLAYRIESKPAYDLRDILFEARKSTFKSYGTPMEARKSGYRIWLFVITICSLGLVCSLYAQGDEASRLAAGEIIAYSESVEGTDVKRGTVIAAINAPPEIVWQVITDNNHFREFMPKTLESMLVSPEKLKEVLQKAPRTREEVEKLLGKDLPHLSQYRSAGDHYVVYFYSLLDFPWPVSDKWYIIKIQRDETRASENIYSERWDLEIGNLAANNGYWLLEPYGKGITKVTYQLLTDPGGNIPKSFIEIGTKVTMPDIIRAVRERAFKISEKDKVQKEHN
jgi:hypothetical protein